MLCRLISPKWMNLPTLEGEYTNEEIQSYNAQGYNVYTFCNHPSGEYSSPISGSDINVFNYCFVDMDLKDQHYTSKDAFIQAIGDYGITPSKVIDSGNGIHCYWKVTNLDAMSYLRFQRRLMRVFKTDDAVGHLLQLMRVPGTVNTKHKDNPVPCIQLYEDNIQYTAEELDRLLPPITAEDEKYCQTHYNNTYNINKDKYTIDDTIPPKFGKLLRDNAEAKSLWTEQSDDRSKSDFRLAHLMFASGFSKEEAASVLVNSAKALQRAPVHRKTYASNIIDKIWTFEKGPIEAKEALSNSVKDILSRPTDTIKGMRVPCWPYIDNTVRGFRLGHVMGLVAGSGVGKTAFTLNAFMGFAVSNPDLEHFFCPLEETDRDIAERWKAMCGEKTHLYEKVHILSNYTPDGKFRDLSLKDIKTHILDFQETTGKKAGCVVIDHIGVLCNENKLGQDEGVKKIAKEMKGFAEETQTFLIMQSQTARSKAGIGDIELDKDAAFGTSVFENFCDYLVTLWQPLKRVYSEGAPTVMAFKFCKIRHKKQGVDVIQEDKPYSMFFDPSTQLLRDVTHEEEIAFKFFLQKATNKRKLDKKSELVEYTSTKVVEADEKRFHS